ncbi:hypothetical protein ACTXT7_009073 [Hymenolepis weldensis]
MSSEIFRAVRFTEQRDVRQGFKEDPPLFIISLGHLGYADDQCLITSPIEKAKQLLQGFKTILDKYVMEMGYDETVWMCVDADLNQLFPQINDHDINCMSSFIYLGFRVNDKDLTDDAVKLNFIKIKRQLVKLRSILRSKVLSTKTLAKILETFVELVLLYDLSAIVYRKVNDNG